jgi:hypothetical protein
MGGGVADVTTIATISSIVYIVAVVADIVLTKFSIEDYKSLCIS